MLTHARWLFGSGALFNALVALGLLFLVSVLGPLLALDAALGTNLMMRDLAALLIGAYGISYFCVAVQPQRFRSYVAFGAFSKALVVVAVYGHWMAGHIGWQLPALATVDAIYCVLFMQFLRRYPA